MDGAAAVVPAAGSAKERFKMAVHRAVGSSRYANVAAFLAYLGYIQGGCVFGLLAAILGLDLPHGRMAGHMLRVLGTRFAHSPRSVPVVDDTRGAVVFLCNHRSWGDFWIDAGILGGTSFVSRWMVAPAIPWSALWGYVHGWMWFFDRNANRHEGWVAWMEKFYRSCHELFPNKGLVVYPEGTRSHLPTGNPLKKKGLVAIYNLGWPVQVVISHGKEALMDEKKGLLGMGRQIVSSVSESLRPKDFPTSDAFVDAVGDVWSKTWSDAYSTATSNEGITRPTAPLPGVIVRNGGLRNRRLLKARIIVAVLVALAALWRWYRASRAAAKEEEQKKKAKS